MKHDISLNICIHYSLGGVLQDDDAGCTLTPDLGFQTVHTFPKKFKSITSDVKGLQTAVFAH